MDEIEVSMHDVSMSLHNNKKSKIKADSLITTQQYTLIFGIIPTILNLNAKFLKQLEV